MSLRRARGRCAHAGTGLAATGAGAARCRGHARLDAGEAARLAGCSAGQPLGPRARLGRVPRLCTGARASSRLQRRGAAHPYPVKAAAPATGSCAAKRGAARRRSCTEQPRPSRARAGQVERRREAARPPPPRPRDVGSRARALPGATCPLCRRASRLGLHAAARGCWGLALAPSGAGRRQEEREMVRVQTLTACSYGLA